MAPMAGPGGHHGKDDFPWWLVALATLGVVASIAIAANGLYAQIFSLLLNGIGVTIFVTLVAFTLAMLLGLGLALLGLSDFLVLRQVARFYIEIVRGIPILVLLAYIAFVGTPAFVAVYNGVISPLISAGWTSPLITRDVPFIWRTIIALTIAYSSFIAEIFRAGIQAVDQGQIEAAKALGLSRFQRFRLVVFPQAIRVILPPLSNDFIAMVKDSSLVSVLGVADISQLAKLYYSANFRYFETLSILAFIYLLLTIGLSLLLRQLEAWMRRRSGADRSAFRRLGAGQPPDVQV
ncbi:MULTISPECIES: amino acid ABC transporter permease [unclassified Rhizobium]|uniref:amino acid ABC transporter permease n=1 Tax=unclassified Rhizobium TaxID=2613769 RepID=UPI000EA95335|nr:MULTISPECIES: amino acid ABC transporter permease [unclassified Rhizobium]AYG67722.1 amino acid ABC transporter permease [Rhizobium sp. CCGE531]AYG74113.1 amino acid ABC transporter permease [Rhizobium sp. CCGE532]